MKCSQETNVNRIPVPALFRTKQMMLEHYSVHFLQRGEFYWLQLGNLLTAHVLATLLKGRLGEYVNLLPRCEPPPAFRVIDLCMFPEAWKWGNALDTLGMRERKEKLAETRGINGGSEAGCSISPSFKNHQQALHRPCV